MQLKKYAAMKSRIHILLVFSFMLLLPALGHGQCKNFAKKVCRLELSPYIHDGNYNAAILTEGEEAELFKTFYAGQEYRMAVCGSESLPKVEFTVMTVDRKVIYSNASNGYASNWTFNVEATQQLIVVVKVPSAASSSDDDELCSGCVSIMFGLKIDA